jgi:hypothetical protein
MSRRSFPQIDPSALRDHADEARVDRVWERIEHSVAHRADRRQRPAAMLAYVAIAAALGAFGAGLAVGKVTWGRRAPVAELPIATPAIEKSRVEVLAAGSQMRNFPLESGGEITLDAGSMAEVERAGTALTVSLLQGNAAITSGQKGLRLVAGDARINTQAGSRVSVKRNADDLDVRVDDGTVNVTAPDGTEQQLHKNDEKRTLPLHTTVASARNEAPPRRIPALPQRTPQKARNAAAKDPAQPEWLARYQKNDDDGALALLDKQGGVDQAINQARSAGELMAIGDMMRRHGRSPAAAMRAYRRVVDSFKGDQNVSLAANYLADHYQGLGEATLAQQYRETAKLHMTMADALFCNLIEQEGNKAEAARLAMKYLAKYPNGQCHERAQELVPAEDATPPAGDAPLPAAPPAPVAP